MRPRAHRTPLEEAVSRCVVNAVIETQPKLREAIRAALDNGMTPKELRQRFGAASRRGKRYDHAAHTQALTVEWLVDEWERDHGHIKPNESIDRVE